MQKKLKLKSQPLSNSLIPHSIPRLLQLEVLKNRALRKKLKATTCALVIAPLALFLSWNAASAQESVWNSEYEMAASEFADKNYANAERMLLDAVKEAEKLPKEGKQLLKTLQLLYKVQMAAGNSEAAAQTNARIKELGGTVDGGDSISAIPSTAVTSPAATTSSTTSTPSAPSTAIIQAADTATVKKGNAADTEFKISVPQTPKVTAASVGMAGEMRKSAQTVDAKELMQLEGHSSWTKAVQISADGMKAISGSQDNTVRLWDLSSGKELARLDGHEQDVNSVAFAPTGNTAISGSSDKTVRLWDLDNNNLIRKFLGHDNIVTCVAFSPSGNKIASGSFDGTVRIWDTLTGKELLKMEGGLGTVKCLAFTPDGERLVSGGTDRLLTLWRLRDGTALRKFSGHKGEILSVAVSSDGNQILSTSRDSSVRLWDLNSGEETKCLTGHGNWIPVAKFLVGDKAISGSLDRTFRVWDLGAGSETRSYSIQHLGMWCLAFSDSGERAITGSDDFTLRVWQITP